MNRNYFKKVIKCSNKKFLKTILSTSIKLLLLQLISERGTLVIHSLETLKLYDFIK